jgi:hypothetical protein
MRDSPRSLTLVISIEASGVYTLPWYAGMVWIFVRVQRRERFPAAAVLLWGAAYEAGADGIVGGLVVVGLANRG